MSDVSSVETDSSEKETLLENFRRLLPTNVRYKAESCVADTGVDTFRAVIHADCTTSEQCDNWVSEFCNTSMCTWRVRSTYPNARRGLLYRKDYICQHSNFNKNHGASKKSKDTGCTAKLTVKIREPSRWNRKSKFMADGLLCIISISWTHNHNLFTAEALSYRSPGSTIKETFISYFNEGMNPSAAMKFHRHCLEMAVDCREEDLTDANKNPLRRSVYNWHYQWRNENLAENTAAALDNSVNMPIDVEELGDQPAIIGAPSGDTEHDLGSTNANDQPSDQLLQEFEQLIKHNYARFCSDTECKNALQKAVSRLRCISTASSFASFLRNTGGFRRYRAGAAIHVQPTELSRRRPGVPRGSKRLAVGRLPAGSVSTREKRRHCLSQNINANLSNAKSHGSAH